MQTRDLGSYLQSRRTDLIAILGIAIFFIAFFWKGIFGFQYLISGDALFYNYPLRTVAWRMLRAGELPLWTPNILSGYPLLSMAQIGLAYPLTWGYLFLPGLQAEKIYLLAPFLLTPIFTYAYIRQLARSPLASLLGALTFGYGGMMASPIASGGIIPNAFIWLPLLLLILERSRRTGFRSSFIAASLTYTLSVLTGHAQSFLTVGLLSGVYALFLVVANVDGSQEGPGVRLKRWSSWRPLIVVLGAGLVAIGVSAFQILETAQILKLSVRRTITYQLFTNGSFKAHDLWTSFTTPIFNAIDMHSSVPPLAAILACLATYACIRRLNGIRNPRVLFWATTAIVACFLMMGKFTPFYRIVYYVPLLNLFRVPSRHTAEWTFAAGVLAAYGWDFVVAILERRRYSFPKKATTVYAAFVLLLLGVTIGTVWWIKAQTLNPFVGGWPHAPTVYRLWKGSFVLVLTTCLWRANLVRHDRLRVSLVGITLLVMCFVEPSILISKWWGGLATIARRFEKPAAVTKYLQQFPANENRVYTRVDLMSEQGGDEPQKIDVPNLDALWGLQDAAGYEPLIMERYSRALGGAWLNGVNTFDLRPPDPSLLTADSKVLNILNVRFLVSYPQLSTSSVASLKGAPVYSDQWHRGYSDGSAEVLINVRAMPRAWLVKEVELVDAETALALIRGGQNFDPARTALIETPPSATEELPGGPVGPDDTVQFLTYTANRLVLETSSPTSTFLILSEIYYPGWKATIDGKSAGILVADYLLRGTYVPAGRHIIELQYTAPGARNGAYISAITLCSLALLTFIDRRRKPTQHELPNNS